MARWIRQGTCNRCGQCCGAVGTLPQPDRRTPFAKNWPDAVLNWQYDAVVANNPLMAVLGVVPKGDGTGRADFPNRHGSTRIAGGGPPRDFPWVHIADVGICKDTSPGNDGSAYEPECPFLQDDPGDGSRPCGLVGTNDEFRFDVWCLDEPTSPREEEDKNEWEWRYPDCSYTWVEE